MAILKEPEISDVERLLRNIHAEADNLIQIADMERGAIRDFDSATMMQSASDRQSSLERLINMEELCRSILDDRHGECQALSLERMLTMDAGKASEELNRLRLNAYENLNLALQVSHENRLRMLAAFNVVKDVLQTIGIGGEQRVTYGPGGRR